MLQDYNGASPQPGKYRDSELGAQVERTGCLGASAVAADEFGGQNVLTDQARQLEYLLPRAASRLFALDAEHPSMELPVAQLRVCAILQDGSATITAISEELDISSSAVTQIADRLERAGLVTRLSEPGDRRVKKLALTEEGAELMRSRRSVRVHRVSQALGTLSPDLRAEIISALRLLQLACSVLGTERDNPSPTERESAS